MYQTQNTVKTLPPSEPVYIVADRHRCAICGDYHDERDMYEHDSKWYCAIDCLEADNLTLCDYCGEVLSLNDCEELPNGDHVCDDSCAIELGYERCEHCGEFVASDDAIICESRNSISVYCSDTCAEREGWHCCDDCGKWSDDYVYDHTGNCICEDCYEYNYVTCEGCGEVWRYDECEYSERDYCYYCPDCADRYDNINPYDYKPQSVFYGENGSYTGVELEIDGGLDCDRCAHDIADDANGAVYIKHDGSLAEGIEIVSHPATLDAHINTFDWASWCEIAKQYDFTSHDAGTCGLHVHIDIAGFTYKHVTRAQARARIWALVNYHQPQMQRFSRRNSSQWAPYATEQEKRDLFATPLLYKFIESQQKTRYKAVNLTNDKTIELRIFRGSLNIETVHATIAFADGLARYAHTHSHRECARILWEDLVSWILDTCSNDTARAALESYLIRRNLY